MKGLKIALLTALIAGAGFGTVFAMQHEATVEKGKALFNDTKLGTVGKSCNSCHSSGKGLENAGAKTDLEYTINSCINQALKGKNLKVKSVEMQSLVLYIKSIEKTK